MQQAVVLVVEDDAAVRRFLVRALQLHGLRVRDFASGPELEAYAAESHDEVRLLVTDLRLPGPSGELVALAARQRWPGLPVLFVSGTHEPVPAPDPSGGPWRFLAKPFEYAGLLRAVDELLGGQ